MNDKSNVNGFKLVSDKPGIGLTSILINNSYTIFTTFFIPKKIKIN